MRWQGPDRCTHPPHTPFLPCHPFPSLSLGQVLTMDEERRQEVGRNGIKDLTPSLSHPFPPFTSYLLGSVLNSERSGWTVKGWETKGAKGPIISLFPFSPSISLSPTLESSERERMDRKEMKRDGPFLTSCPLTKWMKWKTGNGKGRERNGSLSLIPVPRSLCSRVNRI